MKKGEIIINPIITEKSTVQQESNKYSFKVNKRANKKEIMKAIKSGKKVLISAHGNSLRALVRYLDNIPPEEISKINIPTGIPLVYELDENLKPIKHYYLGNEDKIKKDMEKVVNQAKVSQN